MIDGKLPPQAIDVEEIVLGSILIDKNSFGRIADILIPDLFYKEQNMMIAEAIIELSNMNNPIDLITVTTKLKVMGYLEKIGGPYYVAQLSNRVSSASNIEYHTRILMQMAIKRNLIKVSAECNQSAYDDSEDVFDTIDKFEKSVNNIVKRIVSENVNDISTLFFESVKQTRAIREAKNGIIGVPAGFVDLDSKTAGWQKSDLIILAARPGMGKTALAVSLARNAAVDYNKPVAIFSLEMSAMQLTARLRSAESEIPVEKFLRTGLNPDEETLSNSRCNKLANSPIYIDEQGGISMFQLRNKARKLKREKGIELIVIDYLQLMTDSGKHQNRESEVSSISRQLKALAKELDVPIICLSQLSRSCESRPNKVPQLSDLRDSGAIEQDADMVMFLYRPEYYGINEDEEGESTRGKAIIIIAKHRNGALCHINLGFSGESTKFYDNDRKMKPPEFTGSLTSPYKEDWDKTF